MIRSSLYDYCDAYIASTAVQGAAVNNTNKIVIFKNCALFQWLHNRNK